MPVMTKLSPTENLLCQVDFSPIGINLQWPAVDDQSGCLGRAHPRMGGVAQQESGNTNYQCPCPTGANALGAADANTAHISFILDLCRPARKCGSLNHRSHFGSRYKLGVRSRTPFWVWVQAHRPQSELHGHWRGLDSGTGAPQAACLLTTSTSMWVWQAARLLFTCQKVFCQCQACHQNPWASLAQLVRA
jgi:hypothetical protein